MVDARDPFAPRFIVFINGKELPEDIQTLIQSVTVEDDADAFDKITLDLSIVETTQRGSVINFLESKLILPGQIIRIDMGYGRVTNCVGAGEIVKIKPSFNREGVTLQIIAYDVFFRMSQSKHEVNQQFKDTSLKSLFGQVISRQNALISGFVFAENIPAEKNVVKTWDKTVGTNDYEFLKKIADGKGLDFFNEFDPKVGKWRIILSEPNDKAKASNLAFTYFIHDDEPFKTLLDFFPEMNSTIQVTDVQVRSFTPDKKRKIETFVRTINAETGNQDTKFKGPDATKPIKNLQSSEVTFKAFGRQFLFIVDRPFKNEKEAKIFAEVCLKERLGDFIKGTGTVVGVETLRSRIIIELNGMGPTWDGFYYTQRVTHEQSDGEVYISKIDVRKIISEPVA